MTCRRRARRREGLSLAEPNCRARLFPLVPKEPITPPRPQPAEPTNLLTPDATSFGGLVGGPICGTLESAWILAGIKR